MDVKVGSKYDPLPVGEFDTPSNGSHIVAFKLRLTNTGTHAYSDSPDNSAKLILSNDSQADTTIVSDSADCSIAGSLNIAVRDSRVTCVAFEVSDGSRPKTLQFTLDSGFADQTGEWSVG